MKKTVYLFLLFSITSYCGKAQKWTEMMRDTNVNFYDVVKEFDTYWKDREIEKGKGYKAFKRWQWFVEPRVYPSGNLKFASRTYALEQFQKDLEEKSSHQVVTNNPTPMNALPANWTALGPFGSPNGTGAGRVQVIRLHPTNTNAFYVGAAGGGFWMTNNNGVSYTTTTDQLGSCGVSDIAIDPINTNNIFIATGDRDAGDTHSTGVLKSTNGGLTWTPTGLTWQTSQQRRIYRLLINPLNPNSLVVASTVGMYRSLDAGSTWSLVSAGNYVDAEYRPGDTTIIYAVTNGGFIKSTNGGVSYTGVTLSSSPLSSNRLSLAVTPANSNYVYVLVSNTSNGFGGLFRSTDAGSSFNLMSSSPNIFDWSANGSGSGGQGWYDIAIDASPVNANEILAGGVNSWKSVNGGSTWTLFTHQGGAGGRPYVHADLHYITYASGTSVYFGSDGGVDRTINSGLSFTSINGNMNIAQIYRMGLSASNAGRIITGHQDNGTNLMNATSWSSIFGADGMDCFVDWNNNNTLIASYQYGIFLRSTNGGSNWTNITNGLGTTTQWLCPIVQDPVSPNTYYCAYSNIYKSTNQGSTWTMITNIGSGFNQIKISPSNPSIIYATSAGGIWKSINAGATWSNLTTGLGSVPSAITDVAMDNTNPNNVYLTMSGYNSGSKVFASHDGGGTWTNYSTGLPNIPVNCIVYAKNSPQVLYIGTDVGVYYREGSMGSWIQYANGLPNVVVNDLEIYYPSGKLRAATYARGVWETNLYSDPGSAPAAGFYTGYSAACINLPIQFSDVSSNSPTSWNWSFSGASPATSTVQNPMASFPAAGIYTVSLISGNANGLSPAYITTVQVVNVPTVTPFSASVCLGQQGLIGVTSNASIVNWSTGQQGQSISVTSNSNTVYNYTASLGACTVSGSSTLFVSTQVPQTPIIIPMPGYLSTTVVATSYQWFYNSGSTPISTSPTCALGPDGYYSVWVANGNCQASSQAYYYTTVGVQENTQNVFQVNLLPNPVRDELKLVFTRESLKEFDLEITNNLGQIVYKQEFKSNSDSEIKVSVEKLAIGIYYLQLKSGQTKMVNKFVKQ